MLKKKIWALAGKQRFGIFSLNASKEAFEDKSGQEGKKGQSTTLLLELGAQQCKEKRGEKKKEQGRKKKCPGLLWFVLGTEML